MSKKTDTRHLRFLEAVELSGTLGAVTIAQSDAVFNGHLDADFRNCGTDLPSADTTPATALVYEMMRDGDFNTLFSSLGDDWQHHLPTQGQIVAFSREHRDRLRQNGQGTLFPFQVEGQYEPFVAGVVVGAGRLDAVCHRLGLGHVWSAVCRHRVVVLQ